MQLINDEEAGEAESVAEVDAEAELDAEVEAAGKPLPLVEAVALVKAGEGLGVDVVLAPSSTSAASMGSVA